jgi:hypothetical protein
MWVEWAFFAEPDLLVGFVAEVQVDKIADLLTRFVICVDVYGDVERLQVVILIIVIIGTPYLQA